MLALEHHFLTVHGVRFHYVTAGIGPPVVLLHGFPETWYSWRKQIPALTMRFRVIAVDLKGFGESGKPQSDYHLPTVTRELVDLFQAIDLDRPNIVGHDWGGVIAFDIARSYSERVNRLVVVNAPLHRIDPLRSWYVYLFQIPALPEAIFDRAGDVLIERGILNAARVKNAFSPEDLRVYQEAFHRPGAYAAALAYYRALKREALPQNRRRYFTKIAVPTLVVWGEEDPVLPISLTADMHRIIPNIRLKFVPDAGHFVHEEQPEAVNALLLDFLSESGRGMAEQRAA